MKTLGDFINSFSEAVKRVLSYDEQTKLALNLIDQQDKSGIEELLVTYADKPAGLLINGIAWMETPEGVTYWNEIYWRIINEQDRTAQNPC